MKIADQECTVESAYARLAADATLIDKLDASPDECKRLVTYVIFRLHHDYLRDPAIAARSAPRWLPLTAKIHDLDMPAGLNDEGRRAYEIIVAYLKEHGFSDNGTCKAFYSPTEWDVREEFYGTKSHLIIVYDGGAIRPVFSMHGAYALARSIYRETGAERYPYQLYDGLQRKLREAGLYFEECTRYYCAVYSVNAALL